MMLGIIIVTLKQTIFNKNYRPRGLTKEREKELSKDFAPFVIGAGGQEFYTKFDYLLVGIIFLSILSLCGSFLFLGSIDHVNYGKLILWVQLISIICLGLSFVIFSVRFRLKNPVGKWQTTQLNTKSSYARKVLIASLIVLILYLILTYF